MRDAGGKVIKWFGAIAEIDDLKRLGQELEQQSAELQRLNASLTESNRDLQHFAATVAHDLQSPLNAISLSCHELSDLAAEKLPDAAEYLAFISLSADRMRKLIRSVFEFAKLDADWPGPPELIDCNEALLRTLSVLAPDAKGAGADVSSDRLPTVPGNAEQLEQLFQHLIGNAIQYRKPEVPARIHVSAVARDGEWLFSVRDNGIGIAPEDCVKLFKVFARLHARTEQEGLGIGLAICHRIVERHGGRIWVESEPGIGSTFYFTLPMEAAPAGIFAE
jgi:signal transduction histidine kinase